MNGSRYVYVKVSTNGQNIEILIQDYGVGIEDVDKAMTPSFTTNLKDEHAGMGITIMQSLSDSFSIHSSLGLGTKVIIQKELSGSLLESFE